MSLKEETLFKKEEITKKSQRQNDREKNGYGSTQKYGRSMLLLSVHLLWYTGSICFINSAVL